MNPLHFVGDNYRKLQEACENILNSRISIIMFISRDFPTSKNHKGDRTVIENIPFGKIGTTTIFDRIFLTCRGIEQSCLFIRAGISRANFLKPNHYYLDAP